MLRKSIVPSLTSSLSSSSPGVENNAICFDFIRPNQTRLLVGRLTIIYSNSTVIKESSISDIGDPYEKPINIELDEIIVYQEGRRVTLETDEHAQLLREARFSGKLNLIKVFFV